MVVDGKHKAPQVTLFKSICTLPQLIGITKHTFLQPSRELPRLLVVDLGLITLFAVRDGMQRVDHDSGVVLLTEAVFVEQVSQVADFTNLALSLNSDGNRCPNHVLYNRKRLLL